MTRFRVLVAEDEPLARAMVADLARRDAEVACVFECGDVAEARELLAQHDIDIAFLDIEMPGATGVELAASLSPEGPAVVFVTAFSRYAPNAFDVEAVDYVLKPFSDDRFFAALDRAKRRVRERRLGAIASQLASGPPERRVPRDLASAAVSRLAFKEGDRSVVLNAAEIVWVEAEDYYVLVHSARGRHMLRATLASLEERLDPHVFLRVHRAALVNLNEVREVRDEGKLVLVLSNGARVPVSRTRRRVVEATVMPKFRA